MLDAICLLSLHAVGISGVVDRMRDLPTEMNIGFASIIVGPSEPRPTLVVRNELLNWYPVLTGGIVASSATILLAFFATRRLFRNARSPMQRSAPRIAAALMCLLYIPVFWLVGDVALVGHYKQLIFDQGWIHVGEAIRTRGATVAGAAMVAVAVVELAGYLLGRHDSKQGRRLPAAEKLP
jgi:hypothetical protein